MEARFTHKAVFSILAGIENWAYLYWDIGDHLLAQTWSLSIEEQFYLFFPAFFYLLLRLQVSERGKFVIFFSIVALSFAIKISILDTNNPHSITRVYYGADTRMDALFMGALVAVISGVQRQGLVQLKEWCIGSVQVIAAICLMAGIILGTSGSNLNFLYFGGFTLFAFAAAILILNLVEFDTGLVRTCLEFNPLVWIGKISYSLYLVHFVFTGERNNGWVRDLFRDQSVSKYSLIGLEFLASFVFATLFYYGVEKQGLHLFRKRRRIGAYTPSDK